MRVTNESLPTGSFFIPCSSSLFTRQTISDFSAETLIRIPAKAEPRLTEQNFGKYEGTPRDGEEFRIAKRDFVSRYDGGESMLHLAQRIYNLLDDVKASGKVCILVAHNGIARVVNSYFSDMTNEEYADFGVKNCEILRYDF